MKKLIVLAFCLLTLSLACRASKIDTLRISTAYTTHIIFPTDLIYADLSNTKTVVAKIVEQNRNMLAIKAREPFKDSSSVSALESNGSMHTFIILYDAHPRELVIDFRNAPTEQRDGEVRKSGLSSAFRGKQSGGGSNVSTWKTGAAPLLSEVMEEPQHLFHIGCQSYDVQVLCEDISSYSDITYFILSLKNNSGISYDIKDATFVVESKGNSKRKARSEEPTLPRSRYGKLSAAPGAYSRIVYSFDKMTLSKDQVLKIYFYEDGGNRNLVMTVDTNDINKARSNI